MMWPMSTNSSQKNRDITLSFDIGHSSIGWAVLQSHGAKSPHPDLLGCGVVTFPADDCLASQRRGLRRQRRHIRATRQRIARIKALLSHLGVLSDDQLDEKGSSAPWKLAATVLTGAGLLDWRSLWDVLRWYAHNRGYDGNRSWAKNGPVEDPDDTEKVENARHLMDHYSTRSMAETICAVLQVDPASAKASSHLPYKTLNAAFPRDVVEREVRAILQAHVGRLPQFDRQVLEWLIGPEADQENAYAFPDVPALKRLPKRYRGSLLFGQLIPRFDNRIISSCPITFARVFHATLAETGDQDAARQAAKRESKVPVKACREFLDYRWALLLANIKVDGAPLSADHRQALHAVMVESGRLTAKQLISEVEKLSGSRNHNLDATFKIHPDAEEALIHDPAIAFFKAAESSRTAIHPFWMALPERTRQRALGRWKKGRTVTIQWMLDELASTPDGTAALEAAIDAALNAPTKGKKSGRGNQTRATLLAKAFRPERLSGRAPYTRRVMEDVLKEVLSGKDPRSEGGAIYRSPEVLAAERLRPIDDLTNNHLIRHRLKILHRLVDDVVAEYAADDRSRIGKVVVEVARDLQEFSGMSAKEITSDLNSRLKDFKSAVEKLQSDAPNLPLTGGLIRKCRIAMDLGWKCPFTGATFDARDLPKLEREHVVPYADRPSNALHALVLTFPEVNRMKGKVTARAFIATHGGKAVEGKPNLSLLTLRQYDDLVASLDTKGHADDQKRKKRRKDLMMLDKFEARDGGFTEGALTQSSHLMRLAARQFESAVPDLLPHEIVHLPGQVTAEVRKSWKLMDHLAAVVPEVRGKTNDKQAIRDITHLHHAVDAITIALASHYLPKDGGVWEALLKREGQRSPAEIGRLLATGVFARTGGGRVELREPVPAITQQIERRLAECRVVQHVPAEMNGLPTEQTTWRFESVEGSGTEAKGVLRQQSSQVKNGVRQIKHKTNKVSLERLMGTHPESGAGKLKNLKGAIEITSNYGIALDPSPEIIPFHKVWHRLKALREKNGGKPVRVLRPGQLIRVKNHPKRNGVWKVVTTQGTLKVDFIRPDIVGVEESVLVDDGKWKKRKRKGAVVWREVGVNTLLQTDWEPLKPRFTGVAF